MRRLAVTALILCASASMNACSDPATPSATDASVSKLDGRFPCDVSKVIKGWCVRCHTNPPVMNAPFPLATYADTQADVPGTGLHVWMAMEEVLAPTVYMPPDAPYLTDAGVRTLLDWIDAGAPSGAGACE